MACDMQKEASARTEHQTDRLCPRRHHPLERRLPLRHLPTEQPFSAPPESRTQSAMAGFSRVWSIDAAERAALGGTEIVLAEMLDHVDHTVLFRLLKFRSLYY